MTATFRTGEGIRLGHDSLDRFLPGRDPAFVPARREVETLIGLEAAYAIEAETVEREPERREADTP